MDRRPPAQRAALLARRLTSARAYTIGSAVGTTGARHDSPHSRNRRTAEARLDDHGTPSNQSVEGTAGPDLASGLVAQTTEAPQGKLLGPLEQIAAIVGNEVILHSTIDAQVYGWLRSQVGARPEDPAQIQALRRQILSESVRRSMLAQTARTLGAYDPAQVEDYVEHAVRQREAEEVERSGGYSRFVEQLHEANLDWSLIAAEERNKTLQQFAEQQVAYGLVGARRYLLFTPREMRDYYDDNLEDFIIQARTDLSSVAFADAAKAEEAATAWSKEVASAAQIESRFGGILSQIYAGDRGFPDSPRARPLPRTTTARRSFGKRHGCRRSGRRGASRSGPGPGWSSRSPSASTGRAGSFWTDRCSGRSEKPWGSASPWISRTRRSAGPNGASTFGRQS